MTYAESVCAFIGRMDSHVNYIRRATSLADAAERTKRLIDRDERIDRLDLVGHFAPTAGRFIMGGDFLDESDESLARLVRFRTNDWLAEGARVRLLGCGTALALPGRPANERTTWLRRMARLLDATVVGTLKNIHPRHFEAKTGFPDADQEKLIDVHPDQPAPDAFYAGHAPAPLPVPKLDEDLLRFYDRPFEDVADPEEAEVRWEAEGADRKYLLELHLGGHELVIRDRSGSTAPIGLQLKAGFGGDELRGALERAHLRAELNASGAD